MRISDWSSDVCSSDLRARANWTTPWWRCSSATPCLSANCGGRTGFRWSRPPRRCWLSRCRPTHSQREARYGPSGRRAAPVVLVRLLLHLARTPPTVDPFLYPLAGVVLEINADRKSLGLGKSVSILVDLSGL